jgi:hypothetical protein
MKQINRQMSIVATNPWFVVVGGVTSIVGFMAYLYEKVDPQFSGLGKLAFGFSLALLMLGYHYSIRVRVENLALRDMAKHFYEINEIYKSELRSSFFGPRPVTNQDALLTAEVKALRAVCQRTAQIFARAIHRDCMVTVKLVTRENGRLSAHTYARSQELSGRDQPERAKFSVGTGRNTGFDQALISKADGRPSYFFSPDLSKVPADYSNERQHFLKFYRSTLVVPIRGQKSSGHDPDADLDHIGYLCVDTRSAHRLNDNNHLYMLAALGHQMYNFMSLMRGRYTVAAVKEMPDVH